jgi:hypothetical protein
MFDQSRNPNQKYLTALNYFLNKFNENQDPQSAIEIAKLISAGKIRCSPRNDGKILYMPSKYRGKCCKCEKVYFVGDFIFIQNSKGWHFECASEEEKQNCEFYQAQVKKMRALDIEE